MEIVTEQRKKLAKLLFKWAVRVAIVIILMIAIFTCGVLLYAKILGPPPLKVPQTTVFYSNSQDVIGQMEHQNQNRYWINLDEISKNVTEATVSIEDQHFYEHHGFDFKRIAGAALSDIQSLSKVQGASTITMQYARNLFLDYDKSWSRKLKEAFYTVRLEMNYSKDKILEGYLNTIYYGHGAYGIQAAAQYYFNKDASELSLSEATTLVAIPKGPSIYAPDTNLENNQKRQHDILSAMVKAGDITREKAEQVSQQTVNLNIQDNPASDNIAPYFQDTVTYQLKHQLNINEKQLVTGGLKVYTTLDTDLQKKAKHQVDSVIHSDSDIQTALISMKPETGAVKALIGGRNYKKVKYNHAVQAQRQPGSAFKPFLYYSALTQNYTPSTTLVSQQTSFRVNGGQDVWRLHNYNNEYANGPITMMQALALSDNIYAAKTNLAIGPKTLVDTANKAGISSPLKAIPSLALGTSNVNLLEMTRAYSTIANYGARVKPHFIKKVVNSDGDVIYEWHPKKQQVLDQATSYVLAQMMTGIFDPKLNDYNKVTGSSVKDSLTHKVAAKTGSTDANSWMIGFTPELTTGVWVGYSDGRPLNHYPETSYSKDIFAFYMESALEGQPEDSFKDAPKDVVAKYVDPDTGKLATLDCPNARLTYFVKGSAPQEYCDLHDGDHMRQPGEEPKDDRHEDKKEGKNWFDKFLDLF
ncbi:transglycosylase domain-containing protein [Tuberibacillus sp. Marseille-P3662]|uniref:transglycosylase domain-containing protein n=1 Tax=Tuberibacillus sp. Marseille-P3662 TaxID=1965358 RepID=UPI000A1CB375|nr:transglycosylase domain-containing protein [Tuberibacillus sp. Marseille-P3662]